MAKDKFILVSLKEEESKKLAQIISNDTSRKILDFLADKEMSESEIANRLEIPISTVHYNLQALVKAQLVEAEEFHYSKKGKEVLHYRLANKYVIIAPKSTFGIREKLKRIIPVVMLAIFGTWILNFYNPEQIPQPSTVMKALPKAMMADEAAIAPAAEVVKQALIAEPALWFLIGSAFTVILIIVIEFIIYKRNN